MNKINKIIQKAKLSDFSIFPKWSIRKMVFVAILIAISVAFTTVSSQIIPWVNISSYKFAFIGLPVKITGFIFGPLIGFLVGFISDLISLLFVPPVGYSPIYSLATAINGLVSGIFGMYFMQFINNAFSVTFRINNINLKIHKLASKLRIAESKEDTKAEVKYAQKIITLNNKKTFISENGSDRLLANIYLINGVLFISIVISFIFIYVGYLTKDEWISNGIVKNRWALVALMTAGMGAMIIFIVVARFKMSLKKYKIFVPIIVFSSFLELINIPLLSIGDLYTLGNGDLSNIYTWISQHILISPIKIWFNVFVIYYSYLVVAKLINKNANLSY
ncbi:folate ECF transporter S component [Mycoplasma sp. NEAQ87857]|uniref:ECF transporter S component n=1 Tax=Mycoplasma sp. NEAQ87857 TaxID=2683967 RepID=UPI0013179D5B|nr:ECF transporter S component [Mycoplasma sp. NEAQ87857]QGZ97360.1 folate ECF transporter S component [Mycoplasma sp. NEAQ87857]